MDILDHLAVALGFATLAGLNLYLTVLVTGMAIRFNWIQLHDQYHDLAVLGEWPVLAVAAVLFLLEFFADKVPWVDSLWDMIHTLIRPVGGALLAISALGATDPAFKIIIALVAGSATLVTHGFKASTRLAVNTSPEPVSNIVVSATEDAAVVGGLVLMNASPILALGVFSAFLAFAIYFTPRFFRRIKASLWLFYRKLRAPAANRIAPPGDFPVKLTSAEALALGLEFDGRDPDVAWALPTLSGRIRGLRGFPPNLFGKLVAENTKPGVVYFAGMKKGRPCVKMIPLAGCRFTHEPRFLSEDLVIRNRGAKLKITLRFSRSEGPLVEELLSKLEILQAGGMTQEIDDTEAAAENATGVARASSP